MSNGKLEQHIRRLQVAPGTVACMWLGQAGFLLKSPEGVIVMIDPYLSDWAEVQWGIQRVIEPPIDPMELQPDVLLVSHLHEDHLDAPIVKLWAQMPSQGLFAGPNTCSARAVAWGWPADRVKTMTLGDRIQHQDVIATATFSRHEAPEGPAGDTFGYLVEIGGRKVWFAGDTDYDARLRPMRNEAIDVALVPINGVGANMSAQEAALLISIVEPRIAVPMHFNMWKPEDYGPGATLDPQLFVDTHRKLEGSAEIQIMEVGNVVTFFAN